MVRWERESMVRREREREREKKRERDREKERGRERGRDLCGLPVLPLSCVIHCRQQGGRKKEC